MTPARSPHTPGRAPAGDAVACGAAGYGGNAVTFPRAVVPSMATVSPVSDVRRGRGMRWGTGTFPGRI